MVDGNIDRDVVAATLHAIEAERFDAVGISVMGGPQMEPSIAVSKAIRERFPHMPIVWGGYFPTLYTDTALSAPYVDYAIRGQGEESLPELMAALDRPDRDVSRIGGLSWKRDGDIVHNPGRRFSLGDSGIVLPYDKLGDPRRYLAPTFLGRRTAAHQAAIGCRFRCTFCGVAAMFGGTTALPAVARLERDLSYLKHGLGADSIQFFDHNFFDREEDMVPLLEVMAKLELPWWCYARSDALLNLSESSWKLVRKSRLRMAYIGAESPSGAMLKEIRKGTRPDQTLEVAELCRRHGVIPELSFMVAPPQNTEEETLHTFEFIRELKKINPQSEIIVYIYTPLPESSKHEKDRGKRALHALARPRRRAGDLSGDTGGMDGEALGRLRVPRGCPLADGRPAPAHPGFRHRVALPLPHGAGPALATLGQAGPQRHGVLALPPAQVRQAVGAESRQPPGAPAHAAGVRSLRSASRARRPGQLPARTRGTRRRRDLRALALAGRHRRSDRERRHAGVGRADGDVRRTRDALGYRLSLRRQPGHAWRGRPWPGGGEYRRRARCGRRARAQPGFRTACGGAGTLPSRAAGRPAGSRGRPAFAMASHAVAAMVRRGGGHRLHLARPGDAVHTATLVRQAYAPAGDS